MDNKVLAQFGQSDHRVVSHVVQVGSERLLLLVSSFPKPADRFWKLGGDSDGGLRRARGGLLRSELAQLAAAHQRQDPRLTPQRSPERPLYHQVPPQPEGVPDIEAGKMVASQDGRVEG